MKKLIVVLILSLASFSGYSQSTIGTAPTVSPYNNNDVIYVVGVQQRPSLDLSNFSNARMNELRNIRARSLRKYQWEPCKKTAKKLWRFNKKLGLPFGSGISTEHINLWLR